MGKLYQMGPVELPPPPRNPDMETPCYWDSLEEAEKMAATWAINSGKPKGIYVLVEIVEMDFKASTKRTKVE